MKQRIPLFPLLMLLALPLAISACKPIQREAAVPAATESGIHSDVADQVEPAFDLVLAQVTREGQQLVFRQVMAGKAGAIVPTANGQLAGAEVMSYVWPTSLNSSAVGFAADQGILALAVTAHPDFDDTPLVDEDKDGDKSNDGRLWHSHWVVLTPDDSCGPGALKAKDIPEGETPALPATWPELPILIDSPDFELQLTGEKVIVYVPGDRLAGAASFNYDGVTAGLKVNADLHAPLLCVTQVYDVASGDLSLPGKAE